MGTKEIDSVKVSINAGAQTVLLMGIGVLLKRYNQISDEGIKTLNNVVINFFLPALLFVDLLETLDPDELITIGTLLIFVLEHMLVGTLIGVGLGYASGANAN
jgi:predicted permease